VAVGQVFLHVLQFSCQHHSAAHPYSLHLP
jgi:hypothetical protein